MSWEEKQIETCSNHFIIELKNQNRKGIKSSKNIQGGSTTIKYSMWFSKNDDGTGNIFNMTVEDHFHPRILYMLKMPLTMETRTRLFAQWGCLMHPSLKSQVSSPITDW